MGNEIVDSRQKLTPMAIPDRTRRFEIQAFPPNRLSVTPAVDCDLEIITNGKTEALGTNIAVAFTVTGKLHGRAPDPTTIGGIGIVNIPIRAIPLIHPCDAHIPL